MISARNNDGAWVPAIPIPYFSFPRRVCDCGKRFFTADGYRGHYALVHVLKLGVVSNNDTET